MKLKNHTKKKRMTKPKIKHLKSKTRHSSKHAKTLRLKMRKTMGGRDRQYQIDIVKYKGPTGENMVNVDVINDPIVIDGFLDLGNIGKVVSKYSGDVENELIITQKGIFDPSHDRKLINIRIPDENTLKLNKTIKKKATSTTQVPIVSVPVKELPKTTVIVNSVPVERKPVERKPVERKPVEPMTLRPRSNRAAARPGQMKGAFANFDDTSSVSSDSTYNPSISSSDMPMVKGRRRR